MNLLLCKLCQRLYGHRRNITFVTKKELWKEKTRSTNFFTRYHFRVVLSLSIRNLIWEVEWLGPVRPSIVLLLPTNQTTAAGLLKKPILLSIRTALKNWLTVVFFVSASFWFCRVECFFSRKRRNEMKVELWMEDKDPLLTYSLLVCQVGFMACLMAGRDDLMPNYW